ncbi:MAG: alpha/beta hydrolase [Rudaea sp.]|uniref:alpha/beta fold hydrolase n=1 Tax=unclassified Rudaea TaxID=2627037 RepID=UPI0010F494AE|nr:MULTISPECIES: alpha/beta hydrolase [unclassified Rudaea]MBN8885403.1 alpha/beta hydrolase [Rudaea sp.]MBR0346775.1 alpha/beta hydrolase [Rudaea sp.]
MQARELTIATPHLRLAAKAWGDPALPPLLAIHGWLDNAASFDTLAPLLAEHFHIVALDLPGHGRSQHRPPGVRYHFIDYLDDVLAAADALGWERFSLLGHSLGGGVASFLAAAFPERVQNLFLIEVAGAVSAPADKSLAQLQKGIVQFRENAAKQLRVFTNIDIAVTARRNAGGLSDDAARTLVLRGIREVEGGWSWSSDPRLMPASPQRFTEDQVLDVLAGVHAPTLFVLAEPMALQIPEAAMLARAAQIPNLALVRLPGNHHLHLENAEPVAEAILHFVQFPPPSPDQADAIAPASRKNSRIES